MSASGGALIATIGAPAGELCTAPPAPPPIDFDCVADCGAKYPECPLAMCDASCASGTVGTAAFDAAAAAAARACEKGPKDAKSWCSRIGAKECADERRGRMYQANCAQTCCMATTEACFMTVAEEVTDRQFNFERAKLEQEGGGGDLEVWVGAGIGVPLLVISISLLARNLWLVTRTAASAPAR